VTARADEKAGVTLVATPDLLWGPLRSGWDPANVIARIRWSRGPAFDLVHAFEARPTAIFPALYLQRRQQIPMVLDWCDWFGRGGSVEERPNPLVRAVLRPVETFFEERFRTAAQGTTVINSTLRQRALELGVKAETILQLPNGSNIAEIRPHPRVEARQKLGIDRDVLLIGYIGAIFRRDAVLMAEAFNRIIAQEPAARLMLAGYFNVDLEAMVDKPASIWRTGKLAYADLETYLAACDVCWLPLRDSGANRGRYPLKVNDYMAAGRPVVATAVGDLSDLVRRGQFGLVTPDRPAALADAVLSLLRAPEQRQKMGRLARHMAETELTWEQMSARLATFYQQLLKRP
jgi:glycosyltransferase involved in cell wall biosynthesis